MDSIKDWLSIALGLVVFFFAARVLRDMWCIMLNRKYIPIALSDICPLGYGEDGYTKAKTYLLTRNEVVFYRPKTSTWHVLTDEDCKEMYRTDLHRGLTAEHPTPELSTIFFALVVED